MSVASQSKECIGRNYEVVTKARYIEILKEQQELSRRIEHEENMDAFEASGKAWELLLDPFFKDL
jgi:hypothetical protein